MRILGTFSLRKSATGIAVVATLLSGAGLTWSKHRARPNCWCGIPCQYDYQAAKTKPPVRALSASALLKQNVSTAVSTTTMTPIGDVPSDPKVVAAESRIKVFQLEQTRLQIDHCAISKVALLLHPDGRWRVSLQGDQNTPFTRAGQKKEAAVRIARNEPEKPSLQILRNEFTVVVRGYSDFGEKRDPKIPAIGKPLMFRLEIPPFWVERGVPQDAAWDGFTEDVKEYFDRVDRVEVDFTYR